MTNFVSEGIKSIKETKKYAIEKNVGAWKTHIFYATLMMFLTSFIFILFGISILPKVVLDNKLLFSIVGPILPYSPMILTSLIMIRYGKYPIRFLILITFYINKGLMKLINKGDMYLWRKTGKDSLVSNFITKHKKIINFILFIPLIIQLLFYMKW